jgi:hypothetical protein
VTYLLRSKKSGYGILPFLGFVIPELMMEEHELRSRLQAAGMTQDLIETILKNLFSRTSMPIIATRREYRTAKKIYALMDACVPPEDVHSPVAHYVITLGARMLQWEIREARLTQQNGVNRQTKADRSAARAE